MARIVQMDGYVKGDTNLFIGSEKTALIDAGMEYCAGKLVEDLKKELGGRPLDYILLTHSHYDHVCGLPALREAWPDVIVAAHPHAAKILAKEKAITFMRGMSEENYKEMDPEHGVAGYPVSAYHVNLPVTEGMQIDLGDICFTVYETPGHTKCSISFYDEINQLLFASETTGIVCTADPYAVEPCYLTSYVSSIQSIEKLKNIPYEELMQCHRLRGSIPDQHSFFDRAATCARLSCAFILAQYKAGRSLEEILKVYAEVYYDRMEGQPIYAFMVNAENAIKTVIREYEEGGIL